MAAKNLIVVLGELMRACASDDAAGCGDLYERMGGRQTPRAATEAHDFAEEVFAAVVFVVVALENDAVLEY